MVLLPELLTKIEALNTDVDKLITSIGVITAVDLQPALDAVTALDDKVNAAIVPVPVVPPPVV